VKALLLAPIAAVLALAACTSSTAGNGTTNGSVAAVTTPVATGSPIPASSTVTPPSSPAPTSSLAPVPRSGPLNGFVVADVTFVGTQGWALGTVGCTQSSGRCSALAHTTDNGRSWRSITPPPVNVAVPGLDAGGCASPCVSSIRFATAGVGYAFGGGGHGALLMTTDAGHHWRRQSGDAVALESLDGNVIRVADGGCDPPGCRYSVTLSAIGGRSWTSATLPGRSGAAVGVQLARTGSHAYLLATGHTAGGAQDARSTLWTSADDGRSWRNRGEPCPQGAQEVDSTLLAPAADAVVVVLCRNRTGARTFVAISTDGGAHFTAGSRTALGAAPVGALGAAGANDVLVSSDDTYRTTDGGRHFVRLGANGGSSPGSLGWLGFASPTVAHAVSLDRRTLWVTTDGGTSWRAGRLS